MRVLVTGGNGFVGSALVGRLLLDHDRSVTATVRSAESAAGVPDGAHVVVVPTLDGETDWAPHLTGVDVVIHTAARVHVMRDDDPDPIGAYRRTNVDGTVGLARAAATAGVRRLVFVSTIKVNGDDTRPGEPFRADDPPRPVGPYAESKAVAEAELRSLSSALEVVTVRPPLVYGPGVKGNFISMMRWLQRGVPLPLGGIRNRRTLVNLDNLVDLLAVAAEHPDAPGAVFLAGDAETVSTPELLRAAAGALGVRARLLPVPAPLLRLGGALLGKADVASRLCGSLEVDISEARNRLGWSPPRSLHEGLAATAAWMREAEG